MGRTDLRPDITKEVLEEYILRGQLVVSKNRCQKCDQKSGVLEVEV